MKKLLWLITIGLALALAPACGDDDDGGGGTDDAGTGGEDAGTGGDAGPRPDAGPVDAGIGSGAATFCSGYETTCGYDDSAANRFDDEAACLSFYEGAATGCVTCIETHLTNAMGGNVELHCPHATGVEAPCLTPCGG